MARLFGIDLHTLKDRLRDKPLQLRVKFHTASRQPGCAVHHLLEGRPDQLHRQVVLTETLPADSFQEFTLPPNLLDDQGRLWIEVGNPNDVEPDFPVGGRNGTALSGEHVRHQFHARPDGHFLLAGVAGFHRPGGGQFSFVSGGRFVSLAVLFIGLSSGTVSTVVEQGTIVGYDAAKGDTATRWSIMWCAHFQGALKIINLVQSFSPIDSLSSGRSITWGQLGLAVAQIVLLLGGFFCVVGIILFARRELATAQGNN
jgi:hypothetical protein